MNVLYITYGLPYPPHGGAQVRDFFLLREIARYHRVTCVCLLEQPAAGEDMAALERSGILTIGLNPTIIGWTEQAGAALRHLAARYPPATLAFWNAQLFDRVRELTAHRTFDLVQLEHSFLVPYLDALPRDLRRRTILDLHNIGALQYRRMAELAGSGSARVLAELKARLMQNWEIEYAGRFARVLTVSADDAKWLWLRNPALPVTVIENGTDTTASHAMPQAPERNALLFVGTLGYAPNADAVVWFCREILPVIRETVPDVSLEIVGRAPGAEVQALARIRGVQVHANVLDTKPYYERANVVIVPLRAGGGTRLKILEAMAFGRAMVSTPIGSEGLELEHGETLLLGGTANEFAERVIYLLRHPAERARLARNARERVRAHYSWEHIGHKLLAVYDEVVR